jgi:hypothetical protein
MVFAIAGFAAIGEVNGGVGGDAIVGTFVGTGTGTVAAIVPVLGLVAGVVLVPGGAGGTRGEVVEGGVLTLVIGAGTT